MNKLENRLENILENRLQTLPKDALFSIAIELDLPDLLSLCNSYERINELICERNDIWNYKLRKEFPVLNYYGKNPKEYYIKSKEIVRNHPDWKNILPLIDIEKYEFKQRNTPKGKIYALLQSLKKEVLLKIINDYNEDSGKKKIKKIQSDTILNFLEDIGLVFDQDYIDYYNNLIKELETYIKNPNYTFQFILFEF